MNDQPSNQPKLLSMLCHGSIFFSASLISIAIPIIVLAVTNDETVKGNAKESLNFHLNLYLYGLILGVVLVVGLLLSVVLIGIPVLAVAWALLALLGIASIVLPIFALVACAENPRRVYRYPFTIPFI